MNTDDLITFIKAAELQNFSKAAVELNYSQASVTVQIKKLEEQFGTKLFDRIGKNVTLTPSGQTFLKHARKIILDIEKAKGEMQVSNNYSHLIRIGCVESLANCHIPYVLERMLDNELNFSLKIITESPKELLYMLDKNKLDLVYIIDKPIFSKKWIKAHSKEESLSFVTSAESPLHDLGCVRVNNIKNQPFFLTEKEDNYRLYLDESLAKQNIELNPILEASNTDLIIGALKSSNGVSFLPNFTFENEVKKGNLKTVCINGFDLTMERQIFYHVDKYITPEMEILIDILKEI